MRNHGQNSWCWQISSSHRCCTCCKWYRYINCPWRTCHTDIHTTYSGACVWWMVIHLCIINCLCIPPCSTVYHTCIRANNAGVSDTGISDVKCAWVQKSTLRIPVHVVPHTCCSSKSWENINMFSLCITIHLENRLTKQLCHTTLCSFYWKWMSDVVCYCTCSTVHMTTTIIYVLLRSGKADSNKGQVAIHIIQSTSNL
jgi:hypothetical protein